MSSEALQSEITRLRKQLKDALAQNRQLEAAAAARTEILEIPSDDESEAIWGKAHNIWLCPDCLAEIDDTVCSICGEDFDVGFQGLLGTRGPGLTNEYRLRESMSTLATVSDAEHIDRLPPSKTAAANLDADLLPLSRIPASWQTSEADIAEYRQLIVRGATTLMISTFSLHFDPQEGIIAYADDTLFDEFSGPAMKDGDVWKIHLGSRVELEPEDHDGSEFIEGLLEDAMLFLPSIRRWSTKKVQDGVWVTKPSKRLSKAWTEEYDCNSDDSDWESGSGAEGAKGDGGEWDSDEDNLEVAESWEPEECLNDAETEEPVLVNRYYESDASSGEEDEGGDMDDTQPSSSTLTDVKEEEPGEKVTNEADVNMDSATEDASSQSDGDVCGSDWDSDEELSGDDMAMLITEAVHADCRIPPWSPY
ncbi:hypothetical protein BKA70DRAFT_1562847 [Coprinopsis sp. MPI-PUGE-AT-0042]|nr:hypothetical protein BKA70DRAFT_1562847 [Coprinopsis sp. MPI-PUGE-AT-0042]